MEPRLKGKVALPTQVPSPIGMASPQLSLSAAAFATFPVWAAAGRAWSGVPHHSQAPEQLYLGDECILLPGRQ